MSNTSFKDYQLSSELLKAIDLMGFESPTRVQEQVIPTLLEQKDIIIQSQTGSGKTAAFAIPICQLIDWEENKPQGLVITPTRELAIQVKEDIFNIGRFKRLKVAAIYGKDSYYKQERELKQKTHVVVGTPGRIIEHIENGTLDISNIKHLVLDEADEMLDMGFVEQIESIISSLPKDHTTVLLSATMPIDIKDLCDRYMKNPVQIQIEDQESTSTRINQERYIVSEPDKLNLLIDISIVENPDSCIIFCNTKQKVDEVFRELLNLKYACKKLHGGMEQNDRRKVMDDFKKGYFRYLVATDVAARGIDIENINLVINYDIPEDAESYVHRIGRTGRIGRLGKAITFATQTETRLVDEIQYYTGQEILLKERPDKETVNRRKAEFVEKTNRIPETKESRSAQLSKEIMKIHVNAGKKTKMRAVDIVGTICNIAGMTKSDIGVIQILDVSTFVEILNNKGELVFQELQKTPIKGRLRIVSKVEGGE